MAWDKRSKKQKQTEQGRRRGRAHEERALRVLSELVGDPSWFLSVRHGTQSEDARGIDIVCETDQGSVHIQVKSSYKGAIPFLWDLSVGDRREFPLIVVIVNEHRTDDELHQEMKEQLAGVHHRIRTLGFAGAEQWFKDTQLINRVAEVSECAPDHDGAYRLLRYLTDHLELIPWLKEFQFWTRRGIGLENGGLFAFTHEGGEQIFYKVLRSEAGVLKLERRLEETSLRYSVAVAMVPRGITPSWVRGEGSRLLHGYIKPFREQVLERQRGTKRFS